MKNKFKEKANKLIETMKEKPMKVGKTNLQFARADQEDINRIEKMSDDDLISAYHSYALMLEPDSEFACSLRDMQLESLFAWEVESRGLFEKSKKIWNAKYNQNQKGDKQMKNKLPKTIDTFNKGNFHLDYFWIEYDGWHFEAKSEKAVINKLLKYIFKEIEK